MLITMRAYDERAASKSGRVHVIFEQDLATSSIYKNATYKAPDGKKKRSKLKIQSTTLAKINGCFYVNVYFSKDDLIQLLIEAFGKRSLVTAARPVAKRSRARSAARRSN